MAWIIDVRNPKDVTGTYNQVEIQRNTSDSATGMADIKTDLAIITTNVTDVSPGYTPYTDSAGVVGTHFYRYRYKNTTDSNTTGYSRIFPAGGGILHPEFRRRMRDTNSANYFFTNDDVSDLTRNAINKLFPGIYMEVIDESLTTLADTEKYNFPSGVFRVNEIEFVDSNGEVVGTPKGYKKRGRQIIFDVTPPTSYTIRLYADKQFTKLVEVPELFDDLILDLMQLEALQTFENDRSKYYRYTTVTNPEGGNLPSIARVIERLEITTKSRLNSLRRVRRATEIHLV